MAYTCRLYVVAHVMTLACPASVVVAVRDAFQNPTILSKQDRKHREGMALEIVKSSMRVDRKTMEAMRPASLVGTGALKVSTAQYIAHSAREYC